MSKKIFEFIAICKWGKVGILGSCISGRGDSRVEIKLYNILGNEAAVLLNKNHTAGSYEMEFNARPVTSSRIVSNKDSPA